MSDERKVDITTAVKVAIQKLGIKIPSSIKEFTIELDESSEVKKD